MTSQACPVLISPLNLGKFILSLVGKKKKKKRDNEIMKYE